MTLKTSPRFLLPTTSVWHISHPDTQFHPQFSFVQFLFWFTMASQLPHPDHDGTDWWNVGFCGCIAPKPYIPHQNSHKRHIRGMSTRPRNDSHYQKLCHLIPLESTDFWLFLGPVKPRAEIQKFLLIYACTHQFTWFISKAVKISAGQVAKSPHSIGYKTKQNVTGLISSVFFVWVYNVSPHFYSRFHPDPFSFGRDTTEKALQEPPEWMQ